MKCGDTRWYGACGSSPAARDNADRFLPDNGTISREIRPQPDIHPAWAGGWVRASGRSVVHHGDPLVDEIDILHHCTAQTRQPSKYPGYARAASCFLEASAFEELKP